MTVHPARDQLGVVWVPQCDRCETWHHPGGNVRDEKYARWLARRDGWQLPTSTKNRARGKPDLCPGCKENQ